MARREDNSKWTKKKEKLIWEKKYDRRKIRRNNVRKKPPPHPTKKKNPQKNEKESYLKKIQKVTGVVPLKYQFALICINLTVLNSIIKMTIAWLLTAFPGPFFILLLLE